MRMRRQLDSKAEAFECYDAYNKRNKIERPWPFPRCWVGDLVEFEVLSGPLDGGCDIRQGTILGVYATEYFDLIYEISTDRGVKEVGYHNFSGNWRRSLSSRLRDFEKIEKTGMLVPLNTKRKLVIHD